MKGFFSYFSIYYRDMKVDALILFYECTKPHSMTQCSNSFGDFNSVPFIF